jgi:hypothetical protein
MGAKALELCLSIDSRRFVLNFALRTKATQGDAFLAALNRTSPFELK